MSSAAPVVEKAAFIATRLQKFEELYAKQQERYAAMSKPIKVTMPDGGQKDAQSWITTPHDIAASIAKGLAEKSIVAKVDGDKLWDMGRPLEADCSLELLDFEEPEAQKVFWHSSSHVLGFAMERALGCKLTVGPDIEGGGFFYEADTAGRTISETDYPLLEKTASELQKTAAPFQRLELSKDEAIDLFEYTKYKADILRAKVPEGGRPTVYRCGDLVDPCRGPHLLHTGKVKAFTVTKNSSSYWQGKADQEVLQRVYGIAFPTDALLKDWKKMMAAAAQNDHRNVGKQQQLWMFHEFAPGACFFFPHGARIYSALVEMIKKQYRIRGYDEVVTPNMFHHKLWEQSGHWAHYSENMFKSEVEKEIHSLKPMNCPGHMLMFGSRSRTYRELPVRYADFGVLHRNELSGALSGLTRVRRFQQDDAHIFCSRAQIQQEVMDVLDFVEFVYSKFGFNCYFNLSTRNPDKWLGDLKTWDDAEARLTASLNQFCQVPAEFEDLDGTKFTYDGSRPVIKKLQILVKKGKYPAPKQYWLINPHDAAFYGPKIDIQVEDCMRRKHQCATVQLDFNLPERFKLSYVMSAEEKAEREAEGFTGVDGLLTNARPVVVHRAVLGSVERCIAVLTEHWAGKWPLWISPRQVQVVPVAPDFFEYCKAVRQQFHDAGFHADVDLSDNQFNKKVRNAQVAQYNFILVCGKAEVEQNTVNVRTRDNKQHGEKGIPECIEWLQQLKASYSNEH
eukprot:NODE_489_length_2421_cov_64.618799_g464_i0.p1 GENE.NODE_489_length_2421_cov_64.618799_g464_i0~~NODE_489_length_2421_cov_64.618799_g464_i0.p1  ORF type:complete len:758 (-),score=214.03 NODE_489_length_2421_cov_64.618799_g464_i0:146-2347(-)